jgi:regulatory protein
LNRLASKSVGYKSARYSIPRFPLSQPHAARHARVLEYIRALLVSRSSSLYACLVLASPRQVSTEQDLYDIALRALTRRAHSIHQMKEYLGRRATNGELVSVIVARLREAKYLDDARYAADYARQHAQLRRQGRFRIARELRTRGVPDQHIDAALDSVFAETDEALLVRTRLKRRMAHVQLPLDQRKTASLYRSLLRAGFSADVIRCELRAATRNANDMPEVTPESSVDDV